MRQQQVFLFHDWVSAAYAQYECLLFHDFFGWKFETIAEDVSGNTIDGFCHNNPGFLGMHVKHMKMKMKMKMKMVQNT